MGAAVRSGNPLVPLAIGAILMAIGFTVAVIAVAVSGISGGAFNPAVAIVGVAMGMFSGMDH
jgi:glycerol uptake facilitator-like aquaporin